MLKLYFLFRLEESSKREAIRTNGPGILNFTVMSRETAKETQLYPMKIRLQHIALAAFIMVCSGLEYLKLS